MTGDRRERVQRLLDQLAARGPDLAPLTPEQALAHPIWWLVLYQLLGRTNP